jgi:sec-independent protein translocase protein TatB
VGPKDLPVMFRQLGRFTGQLRRMARDFSRAMDEAADEAGAKDLARDLRTMSNPRSAAAQQFKKTAGLDDLEKDFERGFEDDDAKDDVDDEGARDTTSSAYGAHTKELAETRAAEAKARREEAVRRANERAASFKGFETAETTPAPAPGEGAPAEHADSDPEPEPLRQDKA